MAVRAVLQLGDPRLREIAHAVKDPVAPEIAALVKDLADTLAHWRRPPDMDAASPPPTRRLSASYFSSATGRRTVAIGKSRNRRAQRGKSCGVGRLPEFPLHFHAGRAAS